MDGLSQTGKYVRFFIHILTERFTRHQSVDPEGENIFEAYKIATAQIVNPAGDLQLTIAPETFEEISAETPEAIEEIMARNTELLKNSGDPQLPESHIMEVIPRRRFAFIRNPFAKTTQKLTEEATSIRQTKTLMDMLRDLIK